jgi:hypothetical protein
MSDRITPEEIDWLLNVGDATVRKMAEEIRDLREALKPFAEAAKYWDDVPGAITHDNVQLWQKGKRVDYLTCGDLRKARNALSEPSVEPPAPSGVEISIK